MDGLTPDALADATDALAALAAEELAERKADLREVRRMAMGMTRQVYAQTLGPEPDPAAPEPEAPREVSPEAALMFARLSHVVRMVVAMEEKIAAQAWMRAHAQAAGRARRKWRDPKRDLLKRIVESSIVNNADRADTGRLMEELAEILEDPGLDAQFIDRRMADVATEVCEAFGIQPHLRHFSDDELGYKIGNGHQSGWAGLPKLPKGMVGEPGIPSVYEMQERAAGRPWPPQMKQAPPR